MAKHKQKFRFYPLFLRDLALVVPVLIVFALFHHVIPRPASAMASLSTFEPLAQDGVLTNVDPAATDGNPISSIGAETSPAPEQTTSVVAAAPGDFSAAFPTTDTGAGALHSYQSDGLRIAINMVQQNSITYYVADVWVKNIQTFRTAFARSQYGTGIHQEPLSIAFLNNALFAVTGDYCGARNKGVVIRNGELYRDSPNGDVCVLYVDGAIETYHESEFRLQQVTDRGVWQAWNFGPALLDNGQAISEFDSKIKRKNPRNSIGYYEPGHYCFITVDGRQEGYSIGMTLAELSTVYAELGCKSAYNLDGGATAEMIFQGELVNRPYNGGRESSDIICFS